MKSIILILGIASLFSFKTIERSPSRIELPTIAANLATCNFGQCKATAKSTGNQCKHCVSKSGDSYCWQHK